MARLISKLPVKGVPKIYRLEYVRHFPLWPRLLASLSPLGRLSSGISHCFPKRVCSSLFGEFNWNFCPWRSTSCLLLVLLHVFMVSQTISDTINIYPKVIYGVVILALTATLMTLCGWHVYLILHNMTTIEYYEGIRAKWLAMKSGQSYRHPFNIGAYKNITLILGPNMLQWLCPTAVSHLKDGVSFPTSRDNS